VNRFLVAGSRMRRADRLLEAASGRFDEVAFCAGFCDAAERRVPPTVDGRKFKAGNNRDNALRATVNFAPHIW